MKFNKSLEKSIFFIEILSTFTKSLLYKIEKKIKTL